MGVLIEYNWMHAVGGTIACAPARAAEHSGAATHATHNWAWFLGKQEVKKFVEEIKAAGNAVAELYEYPGEGHAFMNKDPDSIERMKSAPLLAC